MEDLVAVSSIYSPEYNLFQYLKTLLPAISFVVNGYGPDSPDNCTKINITSGESQHWYERNDWSLQVLTRDRSIIAVKVIIYQVYFALRNKFGLQLPEYTLDTLVFPAIVAYKIVPMQTPGYIGADNAGREMYSFNITLTTK